MDEALRWPNLYCDSQPFRVSVNKEKIFLKSFGSLSALVLMGMGAASAGNRSKANIYAITDSHSHLSIQGSGGSLPDSGEA